MKLRAYIPALYSIKIQERISNNYTVRLHHIIVLVIILPNFAQSSDLLPTRAPLLLILLSLFSPSPGILTSSPSHFLPLVQFQFSPYPTLRVTQRRSQLPLWLLFFCRRLTRPFPAHHSRRLSISGGGVVGAFFVFGHFGCLV